MKKMKMRTIIGIVLVVVAISLILLATTYSRYTSDWSGKATATTATWAFDVTDTNGDPITATIDLAETMTLYTNVYNTGGVNTVIAPGTEGTFDLVIDGTGSQVDIAYTYKIDPTAIGTDGVTSAFPDGLKLYKDAACTLELTGTVSDTLGVVSTGTLKKTVPVYWKWAYGPAVTDNAFAGQTIGAKITVTGEQVVPTH